MTHLTTVDVRMAQLIPLLRGKPGQPATIQLLKSAQLGVLVEDLHLSELVMAPKTVTIMPTSVLKLILAWQDQQQKEAQVVRKQKMLSLKNY